MRKVLLIDDDPVVTGIYSILFARAGYEVAIATDGEAGLAAVYEHRPQAVLLDLSMPKMNGLQWLTKVREDPRFKKLPVVVFTAGTIAWQVKAAQNSDVTYVLSKDNSEPRKVVEAINGAIVTGTWRI